MRGDISRARCRRARTAKAVPPAGCLYATLQQLKLDRTRASRNGAAVVGDVIGKYHPPGDVAIRHAVAWPRNYEKRYPMVDGQGNFGNIERR